MPVCIRSHQVSQGSFQRESFADLPCWILCAKLFLHDFEYQQRYEADEEVRLDALRERRRRHRHALQQRQETDKSTATRSRLQLTPDNVGGQAIVRHAPRVRRRWHRHAPPTTPRNRQIDRNAVSLAVNPRQRRGTGDSAACAACASPLAATLPTTPRNRQIDRNAVSLAVNPRQRRGDRR